MIIMGGAVPTIMECVCCDAEFNPFNSADPGKYCGECENGECEDCCEHSDTDGHCCLICGADMSELNSARAFDIAKDQRKYGE